MKEGEGNDLFNGTLNTFCLKLYGVRHMVKDTQITREETRCHHMGYFRLAGRGILYVSSHRITHTTAFITPVVEHWLEREIAGL